MKMEKQLRFSIKPLPLFALATKKENATTKTVGTFSFYLMLQR
jgi:hypothetical protein